MAPGIMFAQRGDHQPTPLPIEPPRKLVDDVGPRPVDAVDPREIEDHEARVRRARRDLVGESLRGAEEYRPFEFEESNRRP